MILDDDDFGFSAVTEEELKALEKQAISSLENATQEQEQVIVSYQQKLEALHKAVVPLLNNLLKNPEKEYIYWPNRTAKIQEQIDKVLLLTRG